MILQLQPMLPVYVPRFKIEGFAFLVYRDSQEHHTMFTVALDNGEIWDLNNKELRFCINKSVERVKVRKEPGSDFLDKF